MPLSVLQAVPPVLVNFLVTALLAFVVGLELHNYRRSAGEALAFGTTRTLTLISIIGFVLFYLGGMTPFVVGFLIIGLWLSLSYWWRLREGHQHLLTLLAALSVYLFGPLSVLGPMWLLIVYAVAIILMLGNQPDIRRFSDRFRSGEAITLSKFLIMIGLILPLLPDRQIASFITVTWSQVWLAVVVVSGISYASYLLQTYFLPSRGVLLTGLLGGLYSSTAVTAVLSRRAHQAQAEEARHIGAAIVLATVMMYLRLWALIELLGHHAAAMRLAPAFGTLVVALAVAAKFLYGSGSQSSTSTEEGLNHPLEFPTALLFALLFVVFAGLSNIVIVHFGAHGLHLLAFAVGFTDIDPFILSVLAGSLHVGESAVVSAVLIASGSNNLLKAGYAMLLSRNRAMLPAALCLIAGFAISLVYVFVVI